jgi:hypothetical protein
MGLFNRKNTKGAGTSVSAELAAVSLYHDTINYREDD